MPQIIDTTYFLAIQATYTGVEIGFCQGQTSVLPTKIPTHQASKELIPTLAALLSQHQITLQDLAFCIVSCGPAPFTTLRTVIATIQGLAFATGLPLVAVNGLEAFAQSPQGDATYTHTFVLLHAFGHDVYYAQADHNAGTVETGCMSFEAWLIMCIEFLKHHPTVRVRFLGNGFSKHQQRLIEVFDRPLVSPETLVEYLPFEQLAATGIAQWETQQGIVHELTPLYLKSYVVTPSV